MDLSFEERLNFVLKDRKQTPWGKSLGFTGASISHIFSGGRVPGPEFLNAIRRAENVNLNWLLTGEGQPYIVSYHQSAQSLTETVQAMLEDEPWWVYVCSLTDRTVLVFTQYGKYEFKGKWIDHVITDVHVGPGSEELATSLRQSSRRDQLMIPDISIPKKEAIAAGKLGSYELLLSDEGILNDNHYAKDSELQFFPNKLTNQPIELSLMRAVVVLVEDCANDLGETLTSEQKSRVITAVYRHAERLGLTPDDLTPDSIRTAIDVIRD